MVVNEAPLHKRPNDIEIEEGQSKTIGHHMFFKNEQSPYRMYAFFLCILVNR